MDGGSRLPVVLVTAVCAPRHRDLFGPRANFPREANGDVSNQEGRARDVAGGTRVFRAGRLPFPRASRLASAVYFRGFPDLFELPKPREASAMPRLRADGVSSQWVQTGAVSLPSHS